MLKVKALNSKRGKIECLKLNYILRNISLNTKTWNVLVVWKLQFYEVLKILVGCPSAVAEARLVLYDLLGGLCSVFHHFSVSCTICRLI